MKKLFAWCLISLTMSIATVAYASDFQDLSGNYHCTGYSSGFGPYKAKAMLKLDARNSDSKQGFATYHFSIQDTDAFYIGEAVASGNTLAIYFENTGKSAVDQTDRGVGLAVVSHDKDSKGNSTTSYHKFYYAPAWNKVGGNGYETCVMDK